MIKYVDGKPVTVAHGSLAKEAGLTLELQVLRSAAGYYLGTADDCGPVSRESLEYWQEEKHAKMALAGEIDWSQKDTP